MEYDSLRRLILAAIAVLAIVQHVSSAPENVGTNTSVANKVLVEAHRLKVVGLIKAILIDRKDIKARYVRVRYDGAVVCLDGFVSNKTVAAEIESMASRVAKTEKIVSHWLISESLQDDDPYKTHIGEQSEDAVTWVRVRSALASESVREVLKVTEVQAVDLRHGRVTLYLIADAPTAEFDFESHLKSVPGVVSTTVQVVKTY